MVKVYYDNSDEGQRFQPGTTAESGAVDQKFDEAAAGFREAEKDTRRALKFPFEEGMESQEFVATAFQRRNRVLGFDNDGNISLVSGFYYRQDWQPETTYFLNDVVRDPVTTNLYVSIAQHASGLTSDFANTSKWYLAIDADTVRQARIEAVEARDLARDWATSLEVVESGSRGARYYALLALSSEQTTRGYMLATEEAETRVQQLEQSATSAEATATQAASEAQGSANAAAQSEANIQGIEQTVTDAATQVATDAQTASAAAADAELVSERINDTTTMDFLNFELSGPDLIAHFAGYSDEANFNVNAAGELEVTL